MSTGYGVGMWVSASGLVSGRRARGPMIVALALERMFNIPRGMLRGGDEESAFGLDVPGYIGSVGTPTAIASLPSIMRAQALKDDRVSDATFRVAREDHGSGVITLILPGSVLLADEAGSFDLTFAASELTLELIGGITIS
jgi:hypothetical protein